MKDPMRLHEKRVLVLGIGRSGAAAARLAASRGAKVVAADSGSPDALDGKAGMLRADGIDVVLGEEALRDASMYDLAVISPGIDPASELVSGVRRRGIPITGEIELASRHCDCRIVGITGTNGKTTTTGLTAHILRKGGIDAVACGNIGMPLSSVVLRDPAPACAVLELSSFQLETVERFHPEVAVWTNFSPNHLDRYKSVEDYRAAKLRVFENQTARDVAVVNAIGSYPGLRARTIRFGASVAEREADFTLEDDSICHHGKPVLDQRRTRMPGRHNAENLMAALAVAFALGVDPTDAAEGALEFVPPEHRCEMVAEINGVRYINDSKSTNLDALARALECQDRPVILIAGGKDKGVGFEAVAPLVAERVRHAILIGGMRDRIAAAWQAVPCDRAGSMEEAVAAAAGIACGGETVLLSPGTSSYDMFSDYEARGRAFKAAVRSLADRT